MRFMNIYKRIKYELICVLLFIITINSSLGMVYSIESEDTYETEFLSPFIEEQIVVYESKTQIWNNISESVTEIDSSLIFIYINDVKTEETYLSLNISIYTFRFGGRDVLGALFPYPKTKGNLEANIFLNKTATVVINITNSIENVVATSFQNEGITLLPRDVDICEFYVNDYTNSIYKQGLDLLYYNIMLGAVDEYDIIEQFINGSIEFECTGDNEVSTSYWKKIYAKNEFDEIASVSANFTFLLRFDKNNVMELFSQEAIIVAKEDGEYTRNQKARLDVELVYDTNPNRFNTWFQDNIAWFLPTVIGGGSLLSLLVVRQVMISKCTKSGEPNAFCKDPAKYRKEKYLKELEQNV